MFEFRTAALLSSIFGIICIAIDLFIFILVYRTKPRLHTVNHLLICNTSFGSMYLSIIYIINYIHAIYIYWDTSDFTCRLRSYFTYVSIGGMMQSYTTQAISRFFFSILSTKYRWLTTFRTHYIMILIQWLTVLILALPVLIFDTARYYPGILCLLINGYEAIDAYFQIINLLVPFLVVIFIYICIIIRVRQIKRNVRATTSANLLHNSRNDLKILRNILIFIGMVIVGVSPTAILWFVSSGSLYHISLVCTMFSVTLTAVFNILLDREIRETIQNMYRRRTMFITTNQVINVRERQITN
ncbi:unnamed protein product [Adineta ricciae]|uniref:G-protein coupled receptors family 1 profile domain-containing protein n=1 Tax=Adineta ricciae TaxID=249248 RepID=A0A815W233_ADIRI|nr:unnamed protein product [Adineta ricciae]CAF1623706.1 unnamed protein product [Adineta ricciae]